MSIHLHLSDYPSLEQRLLGLGVTLPKAHFNPRYNLAPLQAVWAVYQEFGESKLVPAMWSLVPPWAKPDQFPRPLSIARAETIWERASFKPLVRRYRTLVFANGFYVWRRSEVFYLHSPEQECLALGGLFQYNADGNMQIVLVTNEEPVTARLLGTRSPVVVPVEEQLTWLESEASTDINRLLNAAPPNLVDIAVGGEAKDPRFDGPELLVPLPPTN